MLLSNLTFYIYSVFECLFAFVYFLFASWEFHACLLYAVSVAQVIWHVICLHDVSPCCSFHYACFTKLYWSPSSFIIFTYCLYLCDSHVISILVCFQEISMLVCFHVVSILILVCFQKTSGLVCFHVVSNFLFPFMKFPCLFGFM